MKKTDDNDEYDSDRESDHEQNETQKQQLQQKSKFQFFSNQSGVVGSSTNIINTIIGAGTIGLPYVLKVYGLVVGALLVFIFYLLTIFCCKLLIKCKNITKVKNYGEIGVLAYGKAGDIIIVLSIILNNFLICIIYFIVFGSNIQNMFVIVLDKRNDTSDTVGIPFYYNKKMYVLIQAVICFPFIFAKNMAFLKPASSVKMVGVFLFCFACIFNFAVSSSNQQGEIYYFPNKNTMSDLAGDFRTFTHCFFAYTFHFNFYPIYLNLKQRNNKKMIRLTAGAIGIACSSFLILSIFGYLAYGDSVQVDFFNIQQPFKSASDRTSSRIIVYCLLETGYCLVCLFSLPMLYFECRNKSLRLFFEFENLYYYLMGKSQKNKLSSLKTIKSDESDENKLLKDNSTPQVRGTINNDIGEPFVVQKKQKSDNEIDQVSQPFFVAFSILIYAALIILGVFLEQNNMGILYEITSAICSTLVAFIGPTAFYVKLTKSRGVYYYSALVLLIFSLICAGLAIYGIIVN